MPLDMKKEIGALRKAYADDKTQSSFNMLLTSESGSGKTFIARTCRFPVHIDSFDPGGTKGLRKWIKSGDIVVDSSYESEDPMKPAQYARWKKKFTERVTSGYFDHFGTYMLDSATTWSEAIMNWILKKNGIAGTAPRFTHDYAPQKIEIRNEMRRILQLPCDSIITGHLKLVEDPEAGKHRFRFLTTGQGMVTIPLLFDELMTLRTKAIGTNVKYQLLTQSTSVYLARSRMAGNGNLSAIEEPDIKAILKKCGLPYTDLPKLEV